MTDGKATPTKLSKPRRPRAQATTTADVAKAASDTKQKSTSRARRAPTVKPQDGATKLDAHELHALVAQAAYFKAEARGFAPGGELADWIAAETEISTQLAIA